MWLLNNVELTEIPEYAIGFVYCITNLTNGRKYIGKKNFYSTKRVRVKGRTNKKKVRSESDWREYFGSNSVLLSDVQTLGLDNFKREIIHICKSKASMSYFEVKEQIEREVLFSENYYNEFVGCRISAKHLKLL